MALKGKSVKFTEKQIRDLGEIGERDDRNFNWLVRKAVDEYIKKDKAEQEAKKQSEE